jgi:hypothetical protein
MVVTESGLVVEVNTRGSGRLLGLVTRVQVWMNPQEAGARARSREPGPVVFCE